MAGFVADIDTDQSDKTMCWIPDKLATFQTAGIAETLCKVCPHRQQCGFQKQRQKKAKVWIGAHQLLYRKRNKSIPPVDFLIVDEDPVAAGLEGDNPQQPLVLQSDEVPDDVREAIERLTLGVSFSRADFDVSDRRLRELISLTFAQMRKVKLTQEQEIDDAVTMAQANSKLVKEAEFYRAILNDGPWGMRAYKLMDGLVELKWLRQRRVHGDFDVPMLFADATAQWDAVRHIIDCYQSPPGYKGEPWIDEDGSVAIDYDYPLDPVIGPITDVKAQTPHTSYRQVLFSGAASKFKGEETGANNVARVRRYIEARSVGFERGLLICQQSLESKLLELGLPPNVETAHFNNIRGRDEWKDIDLLIVVGRIQPPPGAMELNAEVLFRAECKTLGPEYYDRVRTPLTGTDEEVDAERHPDPLAELVRWCACEAELIQAIGRGRGVNRTEADPLQVDLINKVPLPDIKIDEVVTWDDAQPDPGAVIAGRYGLRLAERSSKGAANVVAALLPDLFDTASAARQARVYSQAETPNRYTLLGVSACEYTAADDSHAGSLIAIRAPDCRYAVIAYTERALIRRPLEQGEAPPNGADIDADGVLMVGPVYVLKQIPRRLKSKCGRRRTPDTENNPAL